MMRISDEAFVRIAEKTLDRIPGEIMSRVKNISITVEDRPSPELLAEMGLPPGEPLLGLYTGLALPEQSLTWPSFYPDSIILFKKPLLEMCRNISELQEEIEITIVHEIAHYFGISDARLAELGYG